MFARTFTLNQILAENPCEEGYNRLINFLTEQDRETDSPYFDDNGLDMDEEIELGRLEGAEATDVLWIIAYVFKDKFFMQAFFKGLTNLLGESDAYVNNNRIFNLYMRSLYLAGHSKGGYSALENLLWKMCSEPSYKWRDARC